MTRRWALPLLIALCSGSAWGSEPVVQAGETATDAPRSGQDRGLLGPDGVCVDRRGRQPIIRPGREADIVALFAPHRTEAALEGEEGWRFDSIAVGTHSIRANLSRAAARASLTLTWVGCAAPGQRRTSSFALSTSGPVGPTDTLAAAVTANDPGGFWRSWSTPKPPVSDQSPSRPGAAQGSSEEPQSQSHPSNALMALLLALCLLAWIIELPRLLRELRLVGVPGARATLLWLFGLTLAGLTLRTLAEPTFIGATAPLPDVTWHGASMEALLSRPFGGSPIGPQALTRFFEPLLPADPYDAWLMGRVYLGALTIPWAFVLGAAVFRRRAAGLVFAATLAFLPHHVRISASESTQVDFLFFSMAAAALMLMAARSGRLTTALAALSAACAAALTRPEAALITPGLLLLATAAGAELRERRRRPLLLATAVGALTLLAASMLSIVSAGGWGVWPDGAALELSTISRSAMTLVMPDGRNALFDPMVSPIWLYPLVIFGAVALWRAGQRSVAAGFGVLVLTYVVAHSGWAPAVTVWPMGDPHAALLLGAAPLAAAGVWLGLGRLAAAVDAKARIIAATTLGALGCAAWWPAVRALDLDWQRAHHYAIELGQEHAAALEGEGVRVVIPTHQHRHVSLSSSAMMAPLTEQRQTSADAVTVAHALEHHDPSEGAANLYYYEGLPCYLAGPAGGTVNPQCAAMRASFVLTPLSRLELHRGAYIASHADIRAPPPITLGLYRVGRRTLSPEQAMALLPPTPEPGSTDEPAAPAPTTAPSSSR